MIPVTRRKAPKGFKKAVRDPGLAWLKKKKIPLRKKLAPGTKLKPYWRRCLDQLNTRYGGVCAYLCVFVERSTGGLSCDHFIAKSRRAGLAYAWKNYRLACVAMNASKRDFEDVLDPFDLEPETFHLEFVTGRIFPNPSLAPAQASAAQDSIDRLGLDESEPRRMRVRHFQDYLEHRSKEFLRRHSPFVWYDADRQGLL